MGKVAPYGLVDAHERSAIRNACRRADRRGAYNPGRLAKFTLRPGGRAMHFNAGRMAVLVATAAALIACGSKAPEQQAAPASAAKTASQGVAAGDFGVPECDEYFRKYLACINGKVPETARAMVKQSLDQTREQWKRAAATPQGKASLAAGCTQATVAAKQSMAAYGCQW